jgi:hypothetical protein
VLTILSYSVKSGDSQFFPPLKEANFVDIDRQTATGCVNLSVTACNPDYKPLLSHLPDRT